VIGTVRNIKYRQMCFRGKSVFLTMLWQILKGHDLSRWPQFEVDRLELERICWYKVSFYDFEACSYSVLNIIFKYTVCSSETTGHVLVSRTNLLLSNSKIDEFYVYISLHLKSMYLEDQRDAVLNSLYLFYCQVTLHISGVPRTHHQEYTSCSYNHWYKSNVLRVER